MKKNQVLNKLSCTDKKIDTKKIDTLIINTYVECPSLELYISMDHKNKVYDISRTKQFEVIPFWNKIKKQIIKNYGKADYIIYNSPNNKNCTVFNMCYGSCKKSKNGSLYISKFKSQSFVITTCEYSERNRISFHLFDAKRYNQNNLWEKAQLKINKRKRKEKTSNIDF